MLQRPLRSLRERGDECKFDLQPFPLPLVMAQIYVTNKEESLFVGWPLLEQRRQTCRMLMLYKIQSGLAHCPTLKARLVPLPSRQRRIHDKHFTQLTTRTQYRDSYFLPKTIRDWNSLPMEVVEAPTLDAFVSEQLPTVSRSIEFLKTVFHSGPCAAPVKFTSEYARQHAVLPITHNCGSFTHGFEFRRKN